MLVLLLVVVFNTSNINTNVEEFCDEKEIKHEFSTTYTPEQNGVVERKIGP
jgi:hypothetical protein